MFQEIIADKLETMGFEPKRLGDDIFVFEYNGMKLLLVNEKDNESFLSISVPQFNEFADEEKIVIYEIVNQINTMLRYVKLIVENNNVNAVYECKLMSCDDIEDLLEYMIKALEIAVDVFIMKLKGVDISFLNQDDDDDDDDDESNTDSVADVESALEIFLRDIDG